MSLPKISVIIPSRDRPHGLLAAIESIRATQGAYDVEIIAVLDEPDELSQKTLLDEHSDVKIVIGGPGDYYLGKPQDKYNLGYAASTGEWIVTGSDDITFESQDWIGECLRCNRGGFVGISDGGQDVNWCCVIHMASRAYIDTVMRGYLGLPWYHVWWADVEWTQRAKMCGLHAACTTIKLTHHHWLRGNATKDTIAELVQQLAPEDQKTYTRRVARRFADDLP